jgi:hypothetical protein
VRQGKGKFSYVDLCQAKEKVKNMRIKVALAFGDQAVKEDILEIKEHKLGELTDEEIESAIEVNIRSWLDKHLQIEWEVIEED